jgi:hypothetical protein
MGKVWAEKPANGLAAELIPLDGETRSTPSGDVGRNPAGARGAIPGLKQNFYGSERQRCHSRPEAAAAEADVAKLSVR